MVGNIFTSCLLLFVTYSWTGASYVEAVASAFDVSQRNMQPKVAMNCGHFNKYLDINTGHWTDDITSTCFSDKLEVLKYCKKKFPQFEIRNIVEADETENISSWCSEEDPEDCSTGLSVTPFRCLVGEFESDALVVPNLCKFSHLHQEGVCQTPLDWKVAAKGNCRKRGLNLKSTGMLLPCENQVDLYQGVEFVCCPQDQQQPQQQPQPPAPSKPEKSNKGSKKDKPKPEPIPVETPDDPYFDETHESEENEHLSYEAAKERLANAERERMAEVMQQWQEAEKNYENMKGKDKKSAEKLKADMTERFQNMVSDLELRAEQERQVLHRTHENRVEKNLEVKVSDQEQRFIEVVNQEPPKAKRVLKNLEKYLKSIQKQRQHLISHYKHLRRTDPAQAQALTSELLAKLENMDHMVEQNVELLQRLPEIYSQIKPNIDQLKNSYGDTQDDQDFLQGVQEEEEEIEAEEEYDSSFSSSDDEDEEPIEEEPALEPVQEEEDEEIPTENIPDATSLQNKKVKEGKQNKKNQEESSEEEEDDYDEDEEDSYEDEDDSDEEEDDAVEELPTEVRTTLNLPEQETMAPAVPIIAIKPIDKYRSDETDDYIPPVIIKKPIIAPAHSKKEELVRSKSQLHSVDKTVSKHAIATTPVPALAFALACGIMGVITVLVVAVVIVRKKSKRTPINQGFTEIDPNLTVEQRHIVSMQQNGYENPTYKYFEMQ